MTDDGAHDHDDWTAQTKLIRGGLRRSQFQETAEAIYMSSGYVYESAEEAEAAFKGEHKRYVYSRYANPTVSMFEERLRQLEGAGACMATSSGMAAVFAALMCQLKQGDRVVASRVLFGSCQYIITTILPRFGIDYELVDADDRDGWERALSKPTNVVFLETPGNPTLDVVDLAHVCGLAREAGASVVVDNVFATPVLQRPLEWGADVVIYSATKHIDGQGRSLGGAVLGSESFVADTLQPFLRHTGPSLSPFNAWLLVKGLETLTLRLERMCANAEALADFLAEQPGVTRVRYPTRGESESAQLARRQMDRGGTLVAFELAGGKAHAFKVLNALDVIDISNNLGDSKTLITHPATTTHQRIPADERADMGITDGLVRVSVGLEDVEDLKADLGRALENAAG
ncbi:O-succinylhomoserine sulfhydrylase [Limimonas halophila]|uniref:O-succinylhomoserine sulfhydrylase n=1 Tax=Limimonas halophila TaxID=1082479 RepID=A0A1G7UXQ0_9PROT|nr:O-succinylhomoserine sulfhydrylase [Limimonas halophila]SDG52276.1 O-succinylhomoserine sulfhydrylase [Limimonas halophila]